MSGEPTFQQELSIEVKAGQTLVLEIVAKDTGNSPPPPPGGNTGDKGSFEITVTGSSNLDRVYLAGSLRSYEVLLDAAGKGHSDAIDPGSYQLTLTRPVNLGVS